MGGIPLAVLAKADFEVDMRSCLHETAETGFGSAAIRGDIHDVLYLNMVKQETINGFILFACKTLAELIDIQAADALVFAYENASIEMRLAIVGEQTDDFLVNALVQIVSVGMMQLANRIRVFEDSQADWTFARLVLSMLFPQQSRAWMRMRMLWQKLP